MKIEQMYSRIMEEKTNWDKFDCNYLSSYDYDICNYVIDYIPIINKPLYNGEKISKRVLLKESLNRFKDFDNENYKRIAKIVHKVKIKRDYPPYMSSVATSYNIDLFYPEKKVISPGYVSSIHISKDLHDIDIINLGHEYCHALKETNLPEHQNSMVLGEVIPIFYELINYENDFLREMHLEYRLFWISQEKNRYIYIADELEDILHDKSLPAMGYDMDEVKELYEFAISSYGKYLCGFYYALILYNMYKKNPLYILSYVKKVLNHNMTTLEMLNKLNIYRDIKGEIFEKEFNNIKKVLTK